MDITQLKAREADIKAQDRERERLVANEATAKEASRLKSQFLANVSRVLRVSGCNPAVLETGAMSSTLNRVSDVP